MRNKNSFLKNIGLTFIFIVLTSCSSNNAPIDHREDLYHGREGTVKLVQILRSQSIKEIAGKYGVSAQSLAMVNGLDVDTIIRADQIIKIPLSHQNAINDIEEIDDGAIAEEDLQEYRPSQDIDEELARDLEIAKAPKPIKEKVVQKANFYNPTPLNSSQFMWPVDGKVLSHYGKSATGFNEGINISAPLNTVVKAAAEGEVLYVGKEPKVYGNLVILKHKKNYLTAYAHLDKIIVKKGSKVSMGQSIGTVGKTGSVTTPQLHFTVRKDKKTINPEGDRPKAALTK